MAEPQPTSSKETDQGTKSDFVNRLTNKESARFLLRIVQKAEEEQQSHFKKIDFHDRAAEFTGLNKRAFSNRTAKPDLKPSDLKEVERSTIHDQLLNFYFVENVLPSTKALYYSLFGQIPNYVDIRTFRKYLAKYDYVWIRLPSNSLSVIERPKVTFERYFYLKDIIRYREEKREIFYVDEAIMSIDSGEYYDAKKYNGLKKAALNVRKVLSHKDLVKVTYAVSKSGIYALERIDVAQCGDEEFNPVAFNEWFLKKLIPILPSNSVVVIKNDRQCKATKPTLYSIKSEMMEWLDSNNVPYDETMSKCDLLTLIDTYTREDEKNNVIERILNSDGHVLMKLPSSAQKISVAHHVFNLIKLNAVIHKLAIFDIISPENLKGYDENITELEKETMEIDTKVDAMLDDLIIKTGAKNVPDYDSEIPLSDSD